MLSYTKMLGQLHDAVNTTTLAHYLDLLSCSGMVTGLAKVAGEGVRQRSSSPKLQVLNTALMSAQSGFDFDQARADREFWGRLVESAVGAHLANAAAVVACELFYYLDHNRVLYFFVRKRLEITAFEVNSDRAYEAQRGLSVFAESFKPRLRLLVGGDGMRSRSFSRVLLYSGSRAESPLWCEESRLRSQCSLSFCFLQYCFLY